MKGQNGPNECLPVDVGNSNESHNAAPLDLLDCHSQEADSHLGSIDGSGPADVHLAERRRGPYRKGGEVRGNYYECVQQRRQRILSFLQKDMFQICRPDLRRFANSSHAYECLLPYHVFHPLIYEDAMFEGTCELDVVEEEMRSVREALGTAAGVGCSPAVLEQTLVCELLLYYQQRYINSASGDGDGQRMQKRARMQLSKRNTVIRLKLDVGVSVDNSVSVRNGCLYFRRGDQ